MTSLYLTNIEEGYACKTYKVKDLKHLKEGPVLKFKTSSCQYKMCMFKRAS